ncbi:MAG: rRNA pseudouridine synthase [Ardenticatenales bacterium]|nr:rRNA pseudouridine synthase [Ardenticatenales bacterium]
MARERLQKVIAAAGLCSRRRAEELIAAGRVQVNGEVVAVLGATADPHTDTIVVDGAELTAEPFEFWAVHKPPGVVTTLKDPEGRPQARDLVPTRARVYPVGRLDVASSGLLLFTNDGALAHRLMHPRFAHTKVYEVLVSGYPSEDVLNMLRGGITLDDGPTLPAEVRQLKTTGDGTWLSITLREGRKRQIRRMLEHVGYPVVHLKRVAFGPVKLGRLPSGHARPLAGRELADLRQLAGVAAPPRTGNPRNTALRATNKRPPRAAAGGTRGKPAGRSRFGQESGPPTGPAGKSRSRQGGDPKRPRPARP